MSYLDDLSTIWESVKAHIKETNGYAQSIMDLWFGDLKVHSYEKDVITLSTVSEFKYTIVSEKYMDMIREGFCALLGFDAEVKLIFCGVPSSPEKIMGQITGKEDEEKKAELSQKEQSAVPFNQNLQFEYNFENFIVGNSNKFAHAACRAVADRPAMDYNPLFIYGPSGLGKTHLMFAVVNELHRQYPDLRVIYTKGDDFTNYMIDCLSRKSMQEFHNKYRSCDVLLVDDIQFIAGKQAIQEEFFNTFQTLFMENKQIILASDRPPRDINPLELRLRTRFEQGLLADIQPPDLELRVAIIKKKAGSVGITLPDDVLNYLAENLRSNIRQIEGSIKKLSAKSFLSGRAISLELARDCISELLGGAEPLNTTIDKIFAAIFQKYNISKEDIVGKKRTKEIVLARHLAAYLIREITEISLPNIGKTIGGRDHTTVLSSIKVIERRMASDPLFALDIDTLKKEISSV